MAGFLADNGVKQIAAECRANWNATALKLGLYKSNTTPTVNSILANFTECDFAGYVRQSITGWTAPTVAANIASMTADPKTFTRSSTGAAQFIYGYLIIDNAGTVLYAAERDPNAPITVTVLGDSYTVTPGLKIKDQSL